MKRLILMCAVVTLVLAIASSVFAVALTDAQMYLDPMQVPYDYYDRIYLDDLAVNNTHVWTADGDAIIDADILPVLKEYPGHPEGAYPPGYIFSQSDYLQTPNVNYFADITAGNLTVTFGVSAQYNVRVNRASGTSKIWTVFAETGMLEIGSNPTGASRRTSGPSGDVIIVSRGDKTLDQAAKNIEGEGKKVTRAQGVDDTIAKIKAAAKAAGRKVHAEIVGHGAPGMISTDDGSTADGNLIGPDEDDIKKFQEAIDDDCNGLSLFSCSSAKGDAGDKLLNLLASSLGWASGYTVPITVEDGYFNLDLTVTKTLMLANATIEPVNDFRINVDFGEFSMSAGPIPIEIGGIPYSSGELLFTPDYGYPPEDNFVLWNFTNGSVTESLHVLVDCPLFTKMDIPPQRMHIMQPAIPGTVLAAGSINPTLPTDVVLNYTMPLMGSGVFEQGQLLTGWTFNYERSNTPETASVVVKDSVGKVLNIAAPIIREGTIMNASLQPPLGGLPPLSIIHSYVGITADPDVLLGDLDDDDDVDFVDFAHFAQNWLVGT